MAVGLAGIVKFPQKHHPWQESDHGTGSASSNNCPLANVTTRTLRYYDQVGLLKPRRISVNGYRIYDSQSVDQLQLILFYGSLLVSVKRNDGMHSNLQ